MDKKERQQELRDLAKDVRKAKFIRFYLGHDDRAPDGDNLSDTGRMMIAEALEFQADRIITEEIS